MAGRNDIEIEIRLGFDKVRADAKRLNREIDRLEKEIRKPNAVNINPFDSKRVKSAAAAVRREISRHKHRRGASRAFNPSTRSLGLSDWRYGHCSRLYGATRYRGCGQCLGAGGRRTPSNLHHGRFRPPGKGGRSDIYERRHQRVWRDKIIPHLPNLQLFLSLHSGALCGRPILKPSWMARAIRVGFRIASQVD